MVHQPSLQDLVNVDGLRAFVDANVSGPRAAVTVEKHTAGFSNETFYVNRGPDRWVMRRPPAGPLLPTAHDVLREYRFLSALQGKARVPRTVAACEDPQIIGAPFYLMERVDGVVMREAVHPAFDTPAGRRRISEEMVESLVELHAVDWRAAGLTGRDSGYVQRQVDRWSSQWELTKPRTRDLPGLDEVTAWLRDHLPPEVPHTIVHGDYKLDNVMFDTREPRLVAIFDWEMATIGDPLADLGYLIHQWRPEPPPPGFEGRQAARAQLTTLPGFLSPREMMALYEKRSGRSMQHLLFYRVLAAYKLICIVEGLYMHYLEGAAANPLSSENEWRVPLMIASAQRLIATGGRNV